MRIDQKGKRKHMNNCKINNKSYHRDNHTSNNTKKKANLKEQC